ncbi:MAG TPA: transaldolase [Burkholderiales bacterium]|nr:transaldolase [Burkholderiales bacterium]
MNLLESLKSYSVVVADTGDVDAIARLRPQDATTNPSLLFQSAQNPRYRALVEDALAAGMRTRGDRKAKVDLVMDKLAVNFGCEILKHVKGRVSTEVNASLSFDQEGSLAKAQQLIALYQQAGVAPERVLIKLASTWEGIRAAEKLERQGIHCNLTLLFSFAQAVACADAGVTLISPFVGRIYDWYKKERKVEDIAAEEDPGVESVTRIYNYYKKFGYKTQVMGASFRKVEQITGLAGCDLLTIAPDLMDKMEKTAGALTRRLSAESAKVSPAEKLSVDEKTFRWLHNEDAMATDKLAEGIRRFHVDAGKLEQYVFALVEKSAAA